ncbi:MAG: helix-turn-helix domain-containing protein, partial [Spirochaetales bacterium]
VDRASNNRPAALPGSKSDERSAKAADWLLVIGQRLLDQVIVGAFGEPGYSRFLEAFAGAGSSPLGLGTEEIDTLFESAMSEVHDRRPAYRVRARSLLTEALLALYRATLAASTDAQSGGFRMASVIDYIELNYDGHIELESLAKMMATSPTHLSRVFRREIGVPLFEYLNRTRVRKACELLRRTDFSITQIAIEVGYNNVSFFNRYFRKVMRCSPREYRREMRE